jgi:hypothetical protein
VDQQLKIFIGKTTEAIFWIVLSSWSLHLFLGQPTFLLAV